MEETSEMEVPGAIVPFGALHELSIHRELVDGCSMELDVVAVFELDTIPPRMRNAAGES